MKLLHGKYHIVAGICFGILAVWRVPSAFSSLQAVFSNMSSVERVADRFLAALPGILSALGALLVCIGVFTRSAVPGIIGSLMLFLCDALRGKGSGVLYYALLGAELMLFLSFILSNAGGLFGSLAAS